MELTNFADGKTRTLKRLSHLLNKDAEEIFEELKQLKNNSMYHVTRKQRDNEFGYKIEKIIIPKSDQDFKTLGEVKQVLRETLLQGVHCPCCTQFAKVYKRKLNKALSVCLLRAYSLYGRKKFHVKDLLMSDKIFAANMNGGNFSTGAYWGIMKMIPNTDEDKRTSGYWILTDLGEQFLLKKLKLPKHIWMFNAALVKQSDELVSIDEALTLKFSYKETMANKS